MKDDLLVRLSKLDTGATSDALDRLGIVGHIHDVPRLSGEGSVVGRAVTVQLGPFSGDVSERHLCTAAVQASSAESMILVANGGNIDAASWGGILSFAAAARGVRGVVIDGATRDLDEVRGLGLSLYARRAVPVSARGRYVEIDWNIEVELCGISVRPGDYVIADGSGVVVIPAVRAPDVVALAEVIVDRERAMIEDIRSGSAITTVMGSTYESLTTSPS